MCPQKTAFFSIFKIILGNGLLALAYAKWMVPHAIINGGVTSLALVLQKIMKIPLPYLTNGLTILLLSTCWLFLGKASFMKSIVSSLSYMFFFTVFYEWSFQLTTWFPLDFIFACIVIAFGYYCCLSEGASTVGVDVIALVFHQKNTQRSLAKMIRNLNFSVLALGFFTYGWLSVTVGLLFSYIYAWFLARFLAFATLRTKKAS